MMFARGLKRKCTEDEEAAPSYSRQRQSLLDMSLVKLQLCHALAEPSLCRSVLIANTVRQIQEEMTQDGAWRGAAPQTTGRVPLDRLVSTDILCRSARDGAGDGPAAPVPRGPQSSIWEGDGPLEDRGSFQKSLDQILETLESNTPLSVDELFSDVDSSYCSLDAVLTGVVGGAQSGQDGLEALATMAAPPPSASCKSDLGELDHVVGILVET